MIIFKYFYLISNKKISSIDLSKFILKKIENNFFNNYFININSLCILKQAKYSDYLVSKNMNLFLTGIPLLFKDNFKTKLINTTAGSRILKNYYSYYNSTVVNKLKNIGVINFGKLNMDEFAVGSKNFNYYFGVPKNNFNNYLSSGGSSGGGSYLVSKKLIPASIVSDTGGSSRQPAKQSNLIGFKCTYGRISRHGMISYASTLDNVGIICKNILDLSVILSSLSGFDLKDPTTFNYNSEDFSRYINKNWLLNNNFFIKKLHGLNIGFSKNFFNSFIDYEIRSNIEFILNIFEFLGAKIILLYIFFFDFLQNLYHLISSSELYSNLSKYDNFIYNFNYLNKNFLKYNKIFNFNNILKKKFLLGNYLLFNNKKNKYFFFLKKFRRFVLENFKKNFLFCDILITPVFPFDNFFNSSECYKKDFSEIYYSISNLTGLPSINIPSGWFYRHKIKIPLSFQIIGNYFKEARIIQISYEFLNILNKWF